LLKLIVEGVVVRWRYHLQLRAVVPKINARWFLNLEGSRVPRIVATTSCSIIGPGKTPSLSWTRGVGPSLVWWTRRVDPSLAAAGDRHVGNFGPWALRLNNLDKLFEVSSWILHRNVGERHLQLVYLSVYLSQNKT